MKKMPANLKKIIALLNDGQFHSGSELGDKLQITRSAIWKYISQLEREGIAVESMKYKGYRLIHPLILLDSASIMQEIQLPAHLIPSRIEVFNSIASTNDYLKASLAKQEETIAPFRICLAEQQTAGKGRLGRQWFSPFGTNIYLSLLWQDSGILNGLSLVVAVAMVDVLAEIGITTDIAIKWPNDIFYQHQKLAGILIEMHAEAHSNSQIIIGVGMNVNMSIDTKIPFVMPWASIKTITQRFQDRNKLAASLITKIIYYLDEFSTQGLAMFLPHWRQHDYLYGKTININRGNEIYTGIAQGVDDNGHLLLFSNGKISAHASGDSTIINNQTNQLIPRDY